MAIQLNITKEDIFPFLRWKDEVNKESLRADFLAGLTGAIIVLPQGVAFAMIAGMPPIYGLYTAMITPIVAALFGSSRHLISGPNTPISLIVFAAVSKLAEPTTEAFIQMTFVMTFMAGTIQLMMGIGRLGSLVSFVSHTVIVGFTAGAATLILTSQTKNFFGISVAANASFLDTWWAVVDHIDETNGYVLFVALVTLLTSILIKRKNPRLPHMLIAMIIGSVLAVNLGGESVGIKFVGALPSELPTPSVPSFSYSSIQKLMPNAVAVALMGLIQSIAIGRSIALKSKQRIDANQEFIGQGLSNIIGSCISCFASSGSFTRSGISYESGARTPLTAVFAAVLLMCIVLFIAPFAAYLPMPAVAGIIVVVAWSLIDFDYMRHVRKASKRDNIVGIATFLSTLFLDLEFAIFVGVILSLFFFLQGTSHPHLATMAPDHDHPRRQLMYIIRKKGLKQCPQLKIIRIDGSLFFGSIEHIAAFFQKVRDEGNEKFVLILANGVHRIDFDGAEWLAEESKAWRERGGAMYVAGLKLIAQDVLIDGGFLEEIGEEYFYVSKTDAIGVLYQKLDPSVCRACSARVFLECATDPALKSPFVEENTTQ
ncbi:MAG: SulP family inorganic anion transporter [Saprospiraceae bacterium]|nr:SulP family inorganic anion transporter [Saprospiraceae bacterium]